MSDDQLSELERLAWALDGDAAGDSGSRQVWTADAADGLVALVAEVRRLRAESQKSVPMGVFTRPTVSDADADRIRREFVAKHGGGVDRGRVMVLPDAAPSFVWPAGTFEVRYWLDGGGCFSTHGPELGAVLTQFREQCRRYAPQVDAATTPSMDGPAAGVVPCSPQYPVGWHLERTPDGRPVIVEHAFAPMEGTGWRFVTPPADPAPDAVVEER